MILLLAAARAFVPLRAPKIFHLRRDPFERADTDSNSYNRWWDNKTHVVAPLQDRVAEVLQSLVEYPPRQKPGSFNLDQVLDQLKQGAGQGGH